MKRNPCYKPPARKPSQADLICQAAQNVEQALAMWQVSIVDLAKRVLLLIPQSHAAQKLYVQAKRGEVPLRNPLPVDLKAPCQP